MRWITIIVVIMFTGCAVTIMFTGCAVTITPLHKKPVKQHSVKHRKHKTTHPRQSPTPSPSPPIKHPLDLEPTQRPTPMIKTEQITRQNLTNELM